MTGRNLLDIVEEYSMKEGGSIHDTRRYYLYAVAGLRDLTFDLVGAPKIKCVSLDDNYGAYLPDDLINLISVFIVDSSGQKRFIVQNRNMNNEILCAMASPSSLETFVPGGSYYSRRGALIGRLYGNDGKNVAGEYSLNLRDGYINFSSDFTYEQIYIHYLGNPAMIDDDYIVHPLIEPALEAWIYWDSISRSKNIPANLKKQAEMQYYNEKRKVARRIAPLTKQDIKAAYRKSTRLSPKI